MEVFTPYNIGVPRNTEDDILRNIGPLVHVYIGGIATADCQRECPAILRSILERKRVV